MKSVTKKARMAQRKESGKSKDNKPRKPRSPKAAANTPLLYNNATADGLYEAHVDSVWDEAVQENSGELYHLICVPMSSQTDDGAEVGLYREYALRRAADVRDLRRLAAQVDLPLNDERDIPELVKRLWYRVFTVRLWTDENGRRVVDFIDKAPGNRDVPDAREGVNIWDHTWHNELRREEGFARYLKAQGYGHLLPQSAR